MPGSMRFHKYQALGNDYLVLEPDDPGQLTAPVVRRLCDRHFGIGSDGILLGGEVLPGFELPLAQLFAQVEGPREA
jgi:hypothetical protein